MSFTLVPKESKNKINKAGKTLACGSDSDLEKEFDAISLADKWRACHAYPLNTFNSTLRVRAKNFPNAIVAQRLKRMSTIIDKLKRYPAMQLTTMQDIGGVRIILDSVEDVYKIAKKYSKTGEFAHGLVREYDYIQKPRDEDGYRSLHLVYKYKNKLVPSYNGLLIELQIRTRLQHTWATAVETMGTFLGQALKSRQGDREWLNFFSVTSSAFAYIENTPLVPRYKNMTFEQTFKAVANANQELKVLDKIKGFTVAVNEIIKKGNSDKGWAYHLIILNSLEKRVQIKPYTRNSFEDALRDYANIESQVTSGRKIEPVLVSAGPLAMLRQAYPNFFLDISDFVNRVNDIISTQD